MNQTRDLGGYNDYPAAGYQSFRNTSTYNVNSSLLQQSMNKPIGNYMNTSRETFGGKN